MAVYKPEPMPRSPMRILNEFRELKCYSDDSRTFRVFTYDKGNLLKWTGLIVPQKGPHNKRAYEISIDLPLQYPREPPEIRFRTEIYHPNVSEKGEVNLSILNRDEWHSEVRLDEVIDSLIDLIENPNVENDQLIANEECARLYIENHAKYLKKAEEFAMRKALKPPAPFITRKERILMAQEQAKAKEQLTAELAAKPKTGKKVTINEVPDEQGGGPFIEAERLLKVTYTKSARKRPE